MLGSFGLWDPHEIKQADVAQEVAKTGKYSDITLDGRYQRRPVLTVWLVAQGFKTLGVNELAGRFPLALCGILALLVAFRVTSKLVGREAGLLAAFVLGTTPTFLFQGRQLISEVPFYVAILACAGGFAAYLWPADGRRSKLDLVLGGLGVVAGFLAKGLVLGAVFPLLCLVVAVLLSWRTPNASDADSAHPAANGPDLQPGVTVGAALRTAAVPVLVTLAAAGALIVVFLATLKDSTFMILGAEFRRVAVPPTFETTLKTLGFSFFPWCALIPMVLGLFAVQKKPAERTRGAFVQVLVVVLAVAGYILASVWVGYFTKIRFPTLPWLAVGVGVLIHQLWYSPTAPHRLWGIVAAAVILMIHQDYFMAPESIAFSHVLEHAKYPIELSVKVPVRIFGILFALLFFVGLGGSPRKIELAPSRDLDRLRKKGLFPRVGYYGRQVMNPVVLGIIWVLNLAGDGLRFLGGRAGRNFRVAAGVLALAFAGWCAFWLTPKLSLHMSNKALFQVYHDCKSSGAEAEKEKLAQYQVPGRGAAYYNNGQIEEVGSQSQLFELLRRPERWFILIPSSYLASIDQSARRVKLAYHVLDDRSSQFLLISNKLQGKCKKDKNPLRRYVLSKPPKPRKVLSANFENRVRLMGYDVADVVTRGGKFKLTLYFQVLGQMPSGYKIFIHFDQPANRFHGDHQPLDGKYPTQYWLPGDYIVDPHDVEIPFITTPSGRYTMYMGFWLGSKRLKVTEGPQDGVNRVRLGTLRVR
jgi:hypothetical protein